MVLLIIFSYAILFTCIVGIYSLHLYIDKMSPFFQQYKYVFYGILLGVTGILLTGASFASFGGYMVIMGDRYESQLCAIEMQAACLIISIG